ncbi:MAG: hypothetical protein V4850_21165 [Myxococcota bacterium]
MFFLTIQLASAFSIQVLGEAGCHESITFDALRLLREDHPEAAAVAPTGDDEAIIRDAPFEVPDDMRDIGAISFVLGVREPDLRGVSPFDLSRMAAIHGVDERMPEHCIRQSVDDESDGTEAALANCRVFILERVTKALEGLEGDGAPDHAHRESGSIYLDYQGLTDISLPHFWFNLGQAAHALEDSQTHTYRAPTGEVTASLNFVDLVEKDYAEEKDGPSHLSEMDNCEGDTYREARADAARDSVVALAAAVIGPGADTAGKLDAAGLVIDEALAFLPGCDASNEWCDARERTYAPKGCATAPGGASAAVVLAALLALGLRRNSALVGLGLFLAGSAQAKPNVELGESSPFGIEVSGAVSVDRPALAVAVGPRFRLNDAWMVGGDVAWNPWFSFTTVSARPGVLNVYGTVKRVFPMKSDRVFVTVGANAGVSVLLFELPGAAAGSVGPYVGISLLGIEWRATKLGYLVFEPNLSIPIPSVKGTPVAYYQYGARVGLRWGS